MACCCSGDGNSETMIHGHGSLAVWRKVTIATIIIIVGIHVEVWRGEHLGDRCAVVGRRRRLCGVGHLWWWMG